MIGDPISEEDIFSDKKINAKIMVIGGSTGDGTIIFELTPEMRDKLRHSIVIPYCKGKYVTYLTNAVYYEDGSLLNKHSKNARIHCGTADQNSIDKETFEKVFIKGDESYGVELY